MSHPVPKIELLFSGILIGFGAATLFTMWAGWSRNADWAVAYNLYGEGPLEFTLTLAFVLLGVFTALKAVILMALQDSDRADRSGGPSRQPSSHR